MAIGRRFSVFKHMEMWVRRRGEVLRLGSMLENKQVTQVAGVENVEIDTSEEK